MAEIENEDNIVNGSLVFEQIRQRAYAQSLAIATNVAPTDVEMAKVAHKAALLTPHNPRMLLQQMYNSRFSPLMQTIWGAMAIELEAPERMLAQFDSKLVNQRMLYLEYRQHKNMMLCCDQLDVRNPLFMAFNDALRDQAEYQIARTNRDYGVTEREFQATDFTNNTTRIDEQQTVITPTKPKGGLLSKLNIFG